MSYQGEVWELRYEHGTSYKFYRIYLLQDHDADDYRVLFQWGRIGAERGQSKVEVCGGTGSASHLAYTKRDEKTKKGYEQLYYRQLDIVPPDVLKLAAVNERYQAQAQQVVDTNLIAAMMSRLDGAVRLATGTTADQAQAVVVSHELRSGLEDLRRQVLQLEAGVEVLDDLIISKLG